MGKRRRIEREASGILEVTVRLHGWPAEVRTISVVDACWMVDLEFKLPGSNSIMSHTVFQSEDYDKAFVKYEAFKRIHRRD